MGNAVPCVGASLEAITSGALRRIREAVAKGDDDEVRKALAMVNTRTAGRNPADLSAYRTDLDSIVRGCFADAARIPEGNEDSIRRGAGYSRCVSALFDSGCKPGSDEKALLRDAIDAFAVAPDLLKLLLAAGVRKDCDFDGVPAALYAPTRHPGSSAILAELLGPAPRPSDPTPAPIREEVPSPAPEPDRQASPRRLRPRPVAVTAPPKAAPSIGVLVAMQRSIARRIVETTAVAGPVPSGVRPATSSPRGLSQLLSRRSPTSTSPGNRQSPSAMLPVARSFLSSPGTWASPLASGVVVAPAVAAQGSDAYFHAPSPRSAKSASRSKGRRARPRRDQEPRKDTTQYRKSWPVGLVASTAEANADAITSATTISSKDAPLMAYSNPLSESLTAPLTQGVSATERPAPPAPSRPTAASDHVGREQLAEVLNILRAHAALRSGIDSRVGGAGATA